MSTSPMSSSAAVGFLSHALRWLAVICMAFGAIALVAELAQVWMSGFHNPWAAYASASQRIYEFTRITDLALLITLFVGGVGLFRWRRWSRAVLLTWAIGSLVFIFGSDLAWIFEIATSQARGPATMPSHLPSLGYYIWVFVGSSVQTSAFRLIVIGLLMHSEVEALWVSNSPGFEVLPFAQKTPEHVESQ